MIYLFLEIAHKQDMVNWLLYDNWVHFD